MTDVKFEPALEPGRVLGRDARRGEAGRPARLRPPLDLGPPVRDLRRPLPGFLRGTRCSAPGRARRSRRSSACLSARTRSATPGSSPRRSPRSTTPAAGGRSSASAEPGWSWSTGPTGSTSGRASASDSTGSTRPPRRCRPARRRHGHVAGGRPLHLRRPGPPPAPRPAPPADHDRRLRREEDPATVARYADMWNAMGPLDVMKHKVEVLHRHCEAVGRDPPRSSSRSGSRPRSATARPRPTGSGRPPSSTTGRRCRTSRTTTRSGTARPTSWPRGSRRTSSSGVPDGDQRAAGPVRRRDVRAADRRGQGRNWLRSRADERRGGGVAVPRHAAGSSPVFDTAVDADGRLPPPRRPGVGPDRVEVFTGDDARRPSTAAAGATACWAPLSRGPVHAGRPGA